MRKNDIIIVGIYIVIQIAAFANHAAYLNYQAACLNNHEAVFFLHENEFCHFHCMFLIQLQLP